MSSPTASTHTVTLHLVAPGLSASAYHSQPRAWAIHGMGAECYAGGPSGFSGGYSSKFLTLSGASVKLTNGSGEILGLATVPRNGVWKGALKGTCNWTITIPNVPETNLYVLHVQGFDAENYLESDLSSNDWNVTLNF